MSLDFLHPVRLLLLPVCAAAVFVMVCFRRSRNRKERLNHLLRYGIIALTVLAIAGTGILAPSPDRYAWLLLDVSASADERETLEAARKALESSGDRRTGVIVFGREARIERSPGQKAELAGIDSLVDRGASDLGGALELAAAMLPDDANGGIAVISDGRVTLAEESLTAAGVPVNALKTAVRSGPDAQITRVDLPARLYTGQKYTTTVTVHANKSGTATLVLTRNHRTVQTREVTLRRGENTFAFESTAEGSGIVTCEARLVMNGDTVSANDERGAFTVVSGEIGVLLVEGQDGAGAELKKMLEAVGMQPETIPAAMLPASPADLMAWQAAVLVNVDADLLSAEQLSALDGAVKEMGVGLAVFGGDSSYALGSYRGSELEKMLPVTIDVRNKMDLPTTALVLVIDKSGSMTDASYGVSRLALAREAACSALDVLNERDQAGVIAFDDAGRWVVPLSFVTDAEEMKNQIGTIRPGGGTAFYTPLKMAYETLKGAEAQYKHVIFLTDGEAGDSGYQVLAGEMAEHGITLTTVAVGDGADYAGMRLLAEIGKGRMYAAGPFDSLPRIFTRETMKISGAYVQNRTFIPVVTDESMTGFEAFPSLGGYLAATEKPLATVSLVSDRQDPILVWWQYGAGRVLSWTSDVQGGWSKAFLQWDRAPAFFGGLVSWILAEEGASGEFALNDGTLRMTLDAPEGAARAEASVIRPDGSVETVTLERVSADVFVGSLDTSQTGAYAIEARAVDRDGHTLAGTRGGGVVSWSSEYDQRNRDEGVLDELCAASGGTLTDRPENLLAFSDTAARKRYDLTPVLLLLAGALFLFDIAQRRLDWFREKAKKPEQTPEKTGKRKLEKKKARQEEEKAPPQQAAEVLWENMQKRKRL